MPDGSVATTEMVRPRAALTLAAVGVAGRRRSLITTSRRRSAWRCSGSLGALIPVAIGIAILRYRLYDIDRIISRTLGYAVVTGVLGAVFVGVVLLLAGPLLGGDHRHRASRIAVAVSTLVVFALFQPVRRRSSGPSTGASTAPVRRRPDGRGVRRPAAR